MVNPFDRNFFKFFTGFVLILLASFALLYLVQIYGGRLDREAASFFKEK
jgi:hypothetical protein